MRIPVKPELSQGNVCKVVQVREKDHAVVQTRWLRNGEEQDFYACPGYSIIVSVLPADREPSRSGEPAVAVRSPSA